MTMRDAVRYCLYATAFSMPLYPAAGDICAIAALVLSIADRCRTKRCIGVPDVSQAAFVAFMIWSFLSTFRAPVFFSSAYSWLYHVGLYGAVFFVGRSYIDDGVHRTRLIRVALLSAAVVMAIGTYRYMMMTGMQMHEWVDAERFPKLYRRMFSTLQNPNLLGAYLLIIFAPIGTDIVCRLRHLGPGKVGERIAMTAAEAKRLRWDIAFAVSIVLGILLTYSRGIWIALAATVAYWGLTTDRRWLLTLLAIPAVFLFYDGEIAYRLRALFGDNDTSAALRIAIWDSTLYMIEEDPLFGIGWDSFYHVYPAYNYFIRTEPVIMYHAHNMFLNVAAETGIPGLLAYMTAMYSLPFVTDGRERRIMLGALSTGMTVAGLTDHVLFSHQVSVMFWLMTAGLSGRSRHDGDELPKV